jgi:hypothetical protein
MCLLQDCREAERESSKIFIAIRRQRAYVIQHHVQIPDINRAQDSFTNSTPIMANADSPDPSKDLLPVDKNDEEVDPLAPAPEPKLPTRKDASLKEFLSKMDDYAPIVSEFLSATSSLLTLCFRFRML